MKLKIYQVDAFTDKVFAGNPAAVVLLDRWLADTKLQAIAEENNLSETAFLVAAKDAHDYELRWFTPADEVDLCGHATLASAHVLFQISASEQLSFSTRSGTLKVVRTAQGLLQMDFPAAQMTEVAVPDVLIQALGKAPVRLVKGYDYIAFYEQQSDVQQLTPDFLRLAEMDGRGVLVTAPGEQGDFVSRCFFPKLRVNEDPVTGSAHCELAPLWAAELGKNQVTGRQLSARGGQVLCEVIEQRVLLSGAAVIYLEGWIYLD
ncbi:isomerase [Aliidiomarina minuta]|uniref:Isomerase n=1 Tax=Aliidiomarina minuta TaxID=880057 RepID=A0A432W167_9GAMM|nr:PhzF family phenazine biosynthesis protein [Aliidiomarina minuta]RUO22972.1 isomerase [Aliidiomarina minuta]